MVEQANGDTGTFGATQKSLQPFSESIRTIGQTNNEYFHSKNNLSEMCPVCDSSFI